MGSPRSPFNVSVARKWFSKSRKQRNHCFKQWMWKMPKVPQSLYQNGRVVFEAPSCRGGNPCQSRGGRVRYCTDFLIVFTVAAADTSFNGVSVYSSNVVLKLTTTVSLSRVTNKNLPIYCQSLVATSKRPATNVILCCQRCRLFCCYLPLQSSNHNCYHLCIRLPVPKSLCLLQLLVGQVRGRIVLVSLFLL